MNEGPIKITPQAFFSIMSFWWNISDFSVALYNFLGPSLFDKATYLFPSTLSLFPSRLFFYVTLYCLGIAINLSSLALYGFICSPQWFFVALYNFFLAYYLIFGTTVFTWKIIKYYHNSVRQIQMWSSRRQISPKKRRECFAKKDRVLHKKIECYKKRIECYAKKRVLGKRIEGYKNNQECYTKKDRVLQKKLGGPILIWSLFQ